MIAFYKILGHCKRKKNKKQDDSGDPEMSKSTQNDDAYSGNEQYVDFGCLGDENEHQYSNTIDRENQLRNDDANNHEYIGLSSNREPENPYQSLEILNDGDPESSDDYYEYPDWISLYWPDVTGIIDGCAGIWSLYFFFNNICAKLSYAEEILYF